MKIHSLLTLMVEQNASDLFLVSGHQPSMKVNGELQEIDAPILADDDARALILSVMTQQQQADYLSSRECNFSIHAEAGRFRACAFVERGAPSMVLRRIQDIIPELDDLHLPAIIKQLAMSKRGLIVFVGATGTGKSTSLAAMVQHRNRNSRGHITTIEDPIEFIHSNQGCIVTQREVGVDTESFSVALKNTLRQAPDVILIGEIRTAEAMQHALTFAETGHLCLTTLHANNANQAIDRMLHFFPDAMQRQVRMDLSLNLRAVVAQQLIALPDGSGVHPAVEILLNTPLAAEYIRDGEISKLKELMKKSRQQGMQTFDQALFDLYQSSIISYDDALKSADSANEVRLMIKLANAAADQQLSGSASRFSIVETSAPGSES